MAHDILLLFLSNVKVSKDGKKLAEPAVYPDLGETLTTNESAVRYLVRKSSANPHPIQLQKIFAFASDLVKNQYVGQRNANDKTWAVDAVDEGGNPLTHLQFFKYRLKKENIIENIETCMPEDKPEQGNVGTVLSFDDSSNDMDKSLMTIAGMANRIQAYIDTLPQEVKNDVVLHADMTGGFRYASLMMLAVMRMMQYQGVKIGHVLYSNFNSEIRKGTVQEVGDIYRMFDLLAGAEEFVSFGSVNTLNSYFSQRRKTAVLENLIQSMDGFAEAITLSRRKDFAEAMKRLRTSLQKFDQERDDNDLNDALMGLLHKRIKQDYSDLLKQDNDAFTPVVWCLDHDYLQQALTLYTESVPDFLFTTGILSIEQDVLERVEKSKPADDKRDTLFYLFSSYTPEGKMLRSDGWAQSVEKSVIKATHDVITALYQKDEVAECDAKKAFQALMQENKVAEKDANSFMQVFEALKMIQENPQMMLDIQNIDSTVKIPLKNVLERFEDALKKEKFGSKRVVTLFKGLLGLKGNKNNNFYKLFLFDYLKTDIKDKYKNCKGLYNLLYQNIIYGNSNIDEEDIYKAMQTYFDIKAIRNDSAHAKLNPQGNQMSAEELKSFMKEGIQHLRELKQKVKREQRMRL